MTDAGQPLDRRSRAQCPCVDLQAPDDELARSRAERRAEASRFRTGILTERAAAATRPAGSAIALAQ